MSLSVISSFNSYKYIFKIRITPTTIECYNKEGQNVDILFGEDITTIPMKKAQLALLLEDIRIKDISDHPLTEIVGDKWEIELYEHLEDRVMYIQDKIYKSHFNQISLLEYYYF
ncbi:34746_t:CDS:2 [Gigaspora margarita]|uniref:34746_t:CDS:1 n=1 Tax=Gigaspora margarita TaxID=4874 RepID=A0ABN7WAN6_GIGMA|nr:34746_t:CDS:2 [Gigaspora margarita]